MVKKKEAHRIGFFRVLDNLIVVDLLKTLGAVLLVIVIIIASRKFIGILKMAVSGQLAADTLMHFFSLKVIRGCD